MKRILWLSTLAAATFAAVVLTSLVPVSRQEAMARPVYRALNGGYYYSGGFAPVDGGYSGYGYSPYGIGAYTYIAPRAYAYPSIRSYNYSPGIGTAGTYDGGIYRSYGGSRFYGQPYRPAYNPYGYGGYVPFGY